MRKVVDAPGDVSAHDFAFEGNLSFNASGRFTLNAGPGRTAPQTFYRAAVPPGGTPWRLREIPEPGWALLDHTCVSQTGASGIAVPVESARAEIALAAGDIVTCTYRNGLAPAPSGLTVGKTTRGAIGRTDFLIRGPGLQAETPIVTTATDVPVYERLPDVPAGTYEISESPQALVGGQWERRDVRCNGRSVTDPLRLSIGPGAGVVCLFLNEFVPAGSIRIRKITSGDTGTTSFTIRPVDGNPPTVLHQDATTTRQHLPVTATGDASGRLPLGTYELQETTPTGSDDGSWRLEAVVCDGVPFGSAQGRVRLRLTETQPNVTCTFTNHFTRSTSEQPGTPRERGRDDDGDGDRSPGDASSQTNLRITKRVAPATIVRGQPARYTVVITPAAQQRAT